MGNKVKIRYFVRDDGNAATVESNHLELAYLLVKGGFREVSKGEHAEMMVRIQREEDCIEPEVTP